MFNITQICSAFILLLSCQVAAADSWNLPQELNDQNTQVTFAVDSTWHMVHGVTSGLAGKVWLADPKNQASLKAEIRIPVARFNTDNASRDERLREVMAAKEYQEVVLRLNSGPDCSITQGELSECRGKQGPALTIFDKERRGALSRQWRVITYVGQFWRGRSIDINCSSRSRSYY
jgi:hypothetical protein